MRPAVLAIALLAVTWPAAARGQEAHVHAEPALPSHIPAITDADRAAAFPDVEGHAVRDKAIHAFLLLDRLEWRRAGGVSRIGWQGMGWIGGNRDRFWFRTEGSGNGDRVDAAEAHALYGRAITPWWDLVAGVRQDVRPGSPQTWAAIGVQGLAPYWFEVELTVYVGAGGRTQVRLETEYELLVTNRLALEPAIELELHGKDDDERGIGAGLSTAELGLRLRYEIRREIAPYVGVMWTRALFGTADYARADGRDVGGARLVLGLRLWR